MTHDKPLSAIMEVIGRLAAQFPTCFFRSPYKRKPLKVGIYNDLLATLNGNGIDPEWLSLALRCYTSHYRYLKSCTVGAERIALDGTPAGTVSALNAKSANLRAKAQCNKHKRKSLVETIESQNRTHDTANGSGEVSTTPARLSLAGLRAAAEQRKQRTAP